MKNGFRDIIGKRIAAVVFARGQGHTRLQVFLVFPDGTRFEIYGESFSCCSGLDRAEGLEGYVEGGGGKIERIYGDLRALEAEKKTALLLAQEENTRSAADLEGRLEQDLDAWRLTKEAITRAKGGCR